DGEGEIHIVGADADARAAIKAVIGNARKVHVVEHEIAKPELGAAERVQSAWTAGDMLPPHRRDTSGEGGASELPARLLASREPDADERARPARGTRRS
ncbi:MAG: hypothetical protein ACREJ3_01190, partial [Polyangiaceae bacterium]